MKAPFGKKIGRLANLLFIAALLVSMFITRQAAFASENAVVDTQRVTPNIDFNTIISVPEYLQAPVLRAELNGGARLG